MKFSLRQRVVMDKVFYKKQVKSFILTFHSKTMNWTELWTGSEFKWWTMNVNYSCLLELELNFELVHERCELVQHCQLVGLDVQMLCLN